MSNEHNVHAVCFLRWFRSPLPPKFVELLLILVNWYSSHIPPWKHVSLKILKYEMFTRVGKIDHIELIHDFIGQVFSLTMTDLKKV